ncbi:hypothetical protein TVAG_151320 [Trichomonas vaginalis G3]|uniref:Uncharacterized protein n=1 Tax=Trichomonas vaginalis (strain ATCC PRA-98 / G3) TaxID=412133 RepID=A2EQC9_TRIV3|nr:armadillo (ARM) repeat-containing protein family [Trichomonas vaginalis G3]EAY05145.1 hypothetical protein TVAG_151320 [Trichomonas vaginalis G3]KAI5510958.1 armadillo (ARM) repeat-containing protein family [Trichomonas vaginalis G3]|eukprot:XP_001317368.1 hypothetical protein [Trichomonas vaginalis G3]
MEVDEINSNQKKSDQLLFQSGNLGNTVACHNRYNSISRIIEEHPDIFEIIHRMFHENNVELGNILHFLAEEAISNTILFDISFETFEIANIFDSLLKSKSIFVYDILKIVLALSHTIEYANIFMKENIHQMLFEIICNQSVSKQIIALSAKSLHNLAKSSNENASLILYQCNLQKLCSSAKYYDSQLYYICMKFIITLSKVNQITLRQFNNLKEFSCILISNITKISVKELLILLENISNSQFSENLFQDEVIISFLNSLLKDKTEYIRFAALSIIRNGIKYGISLSPENLPIALYYLQYDDELPFVAASEIIIAYLSQNLNIDLDIFYILTRIENGSMNIRYTALDLLLMYITTFPFKITDEILNPMFETLIPLLHINETRVIEKILIIIHSLLRQDSQMGNIHKLIELFNDLDGFEYIQELIDSQSQSIHDKSQIIIDTFYQEN